MAALDDLCGLLSVASARGATTPPPARQSAVLAAANAALLTPALHLALIDADHGAGWHADTRAVIAGFFEMNRARNALLADQLAEAASAMNGVGVRPLLLKGSAELVGADDRRRGRRVITDLDLQVSEETAPAIERALAAIGYGRLRGYADNPHAHAVADLTRAGDGAAIDLHRELLSYAGHRGGRAHLAGLLHPDAVRAPAAVVRFRGAELLLPAPEDRMLHLILQDQIQDRDHFAGRLKLRRLRDLAELLAAHPDVDTEALVANLRPYGLAGAAVSHLYAAHALFDAPIPKTLRRDPAARLQHLRRRVVAGHPGAAAASALVGALAYEFARCRFPPGVPTGTLLRWRLQRLGQVLRKRRFGVAAQVHDVAARL